MSLDIYYDKDCELSIIQKKRVCVIGYGSQGRAHALNLHDSGVDIIVGLHKDSQTHGKVKADGLRSAHTAKAVVDADLVMVLAPDEWQAKIYREDIEPHLKPNATLAFAHGFAVHYGQIIPRDDLNVIMIAPKSPGRAVRDEFVAGRGIIDLIAVAQSPRKGEALAIAKSYACAIGGGRTAIIHTNFRDETETDLFGEQAVLCGGIVELIKMGFETLVEAGYPPELAYFECLHETKLITDLIHEKGIAEMNAAISNNAEFGGYKTGKTVINETSRQAMRDTLKSIQDGSYAKGFIQESGHDYPFMRRERKGTQKHLIETIGKTLRSIIS